MSLPFRAVLPLALSAAIMAASHEVYAAGDNPPSGYCALFTTEQIAAALGKPVKAGRVPEMATDACQWDAVTGKGEVTVMATLAGIWNDAIGHSGLRPVTGIGQKAYVGIAPQGGKQAGAVAPCGTKCPALTIDNAFYVVTVNPAPSDDTVVGLLREFIKRSSR